MPSCNGANGYTSATFAAPPGTCPTTTANCSSDKPANGTISAEINSAPTGIRFGGTTTSPGPTNTANRAGVGDRNNARTGTDTPRPRNHSTNATTNNE
ncbi:hypothetical protein GCM10009779_30820 [Polymorphospora rubra]